MKAIVLSFISILVLGILHGQRQDFKLEFKLRFENQKIYCDVVPTQDYQIAGMQFGINHNSDYVIFDTAYSNVLDFRRKVYNEICPKNVRFLWSTSTANENTQLIKNVPFLTLEYEELIPTNHFICMMQSGSPSCTTMNREAFYISGTNLIFYDVPDICVDYRIQDGAIILANDDAKLNLYDPVWFDNLNKTLQIDQSLINQNCEIRIQSINGARLFNFVGNYSGQTFSLNELRSGVYVYSIQTAQAQWQSGKFVVLD